MAHYLYHAIPRGFQGTTIYPLHQLKEVYPEVYAERIKSYAWRSDVLEQPVYPLDCQWNDCIFLTAANPAEMKLKLHAMDPGRPFPRKFWRIDSRLLEPSRTTVYNFATPSRPHPPEDFLSYDPDNISEFAVIPERTLRYWRDCVEGKLPRLLLYLYIPHILYKGTIDTTNLTVLEV